MNLLAIDTAGAHCLVGLARQDGRHFLRAETSAQSHSRHLLSTIDALLHEAELRLPDLQRLAWSAGPGSFTGLRIAASVIQPLSYSLGIPFLSLSSLEVLAFSALQSRPSSGNTPIPIAVAMDARMNGVYWASFIGKGGVLTRVDEDCLISQDKFLARSHALHEDGLVVGDAWAPEMMGQCGVDCIAERTASSVIALASNKPDTDWNHNATECLPYYVQSSVTWQKRARFLSVERDNSST